MSAARSRGFALLTVLWAIVVLGVLALEIATSARGARAAASNLRTEARARWAARAGLARTLETLDRVVAANLVGIDLAAAGDSVLRPLDLEIDGTAVHVEVLDARARLDLNRAGDVELRRLFVAIGVRAARADSLADAVLDFRDRDDLHRARGAERDAYRGAARPKNAPFDAVDEVRRVHGFSEELFLRVRPYLTVAGDGRVNVNSAPAAVLRTVDGIDESAARRIVQRRARTPIRNVFELIALFPAAEQARLAAELGTLVDRVSYAPRDIEVWATANDNGLGPRARLHARVILAGARNVELKSVVER